MICQKKLTLFHRVVVGIEVASVIDRKGLARAGSWFIYLPAIDTIVTGLVQVTL